MRVAVISDIHGNQLALDAVLQDLQQQAPVDRLVISGDLCLNGPRPAEVLATIQQLRCPVIQGNVDKEIVTGAPHKGAKKRHTIAWTREQIGPEGIAYLAALPYTHLVTNPYGRDLLVVHANPLNQEQAIFPTSPNSLLEHLLKEIKPTIGAMAFGHLHIAYTRRWRHILLVDVGSCGLPRDNDLRASYAILTWQDHSWQAEIRRVEYNIKEVVKQLKSSGIPHVEKRVKILTEARY
ncbi:metallophosphoesterase [Ktedonosporobacter rubrisoli]|uniref:Metallophosphoesterase n=1 Tax=Ktedonosporobacter rubrisoli TaxID=2509675 RepID=A0A4P6JU26_KTERU|nr:metallophosphoesterase family protein [Ktedonosporobacter rubrisoli]QBD79119.1 metallophosphoesterase [Ktedonosporobacter rubrisoli]